MNDLCVRSLLPVSIYGSCLVEGIDISFRDVLDDSSKFVSSMYSAWECILSSISTDCGRGLVKTLICIFGDEQLTIPDFSASTFDGISDCIERAIRVFCYTVRFLYGVKGSIQIALLVASRVLISGNIGMFVVPDRHSTEFVRLVSSYCEDGSDSKLIEFLREYCIVYFKDVNTKVREDFDCYARIYNLRGMYYPCKYARRVSKEEIDSGYRDGIIVEFDREYWVNSRDIVMC